MTERRHPAWTAAQRAVRHAAAVQGGIADVLDRCAELDPEGPWQQVYDLPYERDREVLELWLVEALQARPPASGSLAFELATTRWYDRVDSCDLRLQAVPDNPAGSLVLSGLLRLAPRQPSGPAETARRTALVEVLPLTYAALAVQSLLERIDEDLIGAAGDSLVTIHFDNGPGFVLGYHTADGWEREEFALEQG